MNDLIMKAITLSGEEKKVLSNGSTVVKIKDEKGLSYSFFMKKQDGTISKAYEGYQQFQLGDTVEIHFSEQEKTYEGKPYTLRNIAFFGEKVSGSAPVESPRGEAPSASQGASGRDFDKEAVGKCQSLFLAAYIQAGHPLSDTMLQVGQAKKLAEMVVYGRTEKVAPDIQEAAEQMASEDLPTIQQGEDISVEDIPFS